MAKILVTFNGLLQQEVAILKARLSIGRRPDNDLVLDHLAISGQHAAIENTANGLFLSDLESTNGTQVNGQPITTHLLQNNDVIDIGKHKLKFVHETEKPASQATRPAALPGLESELPAPAAKIKVLNGNNAGREIKLTKAVTTLGSPAVLVVAITRKEQDYFIAHIQGSALPTINERPIISKIQLNNGDVIGLAGTRMGFSL